jgi:hypothetical protein
VRRQSLSVFRLFASASKPTFRTCFADSGARRSRSRSHGHIVPVRPGERGTILRADHARHRMARAAFGKPKPRVLQIVASYVARSAFWPFRFLTFPSKSLDFIGSIHAA